MLLRKINNRVAFGVYDTTDRSSISFIDYRGNGAWKEHSIASKYFFKTGQPITLDEAFELVPPFYWTENNMHSWAWRAFEYYQNPAVEIPASNPLGENIHIQEKKSVFPKSIRTWWDKKNYYEHWEYNKYGDCFIVYNKKPPWTWKRFYHEVLAPICTVIVVGWILVQLMKFAGCSGGPPPWPTG